MQTYSKGIVKRLRIVKGHLVSLEEMIRVKGCCIFVSQQTKAVIGGLKKVDEIIFSQFLRNYFKNKNNSIGDEKNIEEILKVFKNRH